MTAERGWYRGLGITTWWREVRHNAALVSSIALATFLTTTLVSLAPRVLQQASQDDLRTALESAAPEQRNLRFEASGRITAGTGTEGFRYVNRRGDRLLEDDIGPELASIFSSQQWVITTPSFEVSSFPDQTKGPFPTTFRLRYQDGLDEHMTVIDGRMPGSSPSILLLEGPDCPDDVEPTRDYEPAEDQVCSVVELPVFETAITAQTASDMMVVVGAQLTLTPARDDSAWRQAHAEALGTRAVLRITGIIELSDPELEYWYADTSLHRPRITENSDFRLIFAFGATSPDQYHRFLRNVSEVELDYTWRYLIDTTAIGERDASLLANELEKIGPLGFRTVTQLPDVLDSHLRQRRLTVQILSTSTAGLFTIALASLAALAALGAVQQRRARSLIADRGGSIAQALAHGARTAALVAVPAAIAGWFVSWLAFPETSSRGTVWLAGAVAIGVALIVTIGSAAGRSFSADRQSSPTRSGRRIVVEILAVVLAAGSVLTLRRRGAIVDRAGDEGLDVLLSFTPGLIAIAAGVILVRLLAPIMSACAALASRRRGLATFFGFRRMADQALASRAPAGVIVIAVAVAVFSSVLATSLDKGRVSASWQDVGGDYRIETLIPAVPLPSTLNQSLFENADEGAAGVTIAAQRLVAPDAATFADIVAVDTAAFASLLESRGVGVSALSSLASQPNPLAGEPIPAILVGAWGNASDWLGANEARLQIGAFSVAVVAIDEVDQVPGVGASRPALLVDLSMLAERTNERTAQPTFLLLSGAPADFVAVSAVVTEHAPFGVVTSRFERFDDIAGDPLTLWTDRSLNALAFAALLFAVVAAVAAVAITASQRRSDLALLRILGVQSRQAAVVASIEFVPTVLAAATVGAIGGALTVWLLEPALHLDAFSGGATRVGIELGMFDTAGPVAVLVVAMLVASAITVRLIGRSGGAKMLRTGD